MPRPMLTDAQKVEFCSGWLDREEHAGQKYPLTGALTWCPVHLREHVEAWLLERMREVSPGYFPGGVVAERLRVEEEERKGYV